MNIFEELKNEGERIGEQIKLSQEEKAIGRARLLKYIADAKDTPSFATVMTSFITTRAVQFRSLVAAQYGIIESIWKRKNNDHF